MPANAGQTPGSIRNITYEDQGVRWTVSFEWNNTPDQSGAWSLFEAQFPRDFQEINPDDAQAALLDLSLAVFRSQNIISDD